MRWADLEAAAPDLARLGRERLELIGLAFLGTVRPNGAPRISPVEPFLVEGELVFGAMSFSAKAHDLRRDLRCVLHSVVTAPNAGEGELKLYGRAVEVTDPQLRAASPEAWWVPRPTEDVLVAALDIERAVFVSWDLQRGSMTVRRCSEQAGATISTRSYP
jgi:hypothetical protein